MYVTPLFANDVKFIKKQQTVTLTRIIKNFV